MPNTPTVPRVCARDGCDVDISDKRRGTRYCSRACAEQDRYHRTKTPAARRPGRPPQGEHPKLASAFRQARRVQAQWYAEAAAREAEAEAERLARGMPPRPDPTQLDYLARLKEYGEAQRRLYPELYATSPAPTPEEIEALGKSDRLEDRLLFDLYRDKTEEEMEAEEEERQLAEYFDLKERKRGKGPLFG